MSSTATAEPKSGWADSKTAWKRRNLHRITLESTQKVTIRFPDVGALIKADALPTELIHVAFIDRFAPDQLRQIIGDPEKEAELLRNFNDLGNHLVVAMMVDPKVTFEDLPHLPQEDLEMLKAIAMRERSTDARGVKLGVVELDAFTTFREAHEGRDIPEDHPPFPDPGCEFCVDGFRAFSSLGEVLL